MPEAGIPQSFYLSCLKAEKSRTDTTLTPILYAEKQQRGEQIIDIDLCQKTKECSLRSLEEMLIHTKIDLVIFYGYYECNSIRHVKIACHFGNLSKVNGFEASLKLTKFPTD